MKTFKMLTLVTLFTMSSSFVEARHKKAVCNPNDTFCINATNSKKAEKKVKAPKIAKVKKAKAPKKEKAPKVKKEKKAHNKIITKK